MNRKVGLSSARRAPARCGVIAGNFERFELARPAVPTGLAEICRRVRKPASHLSNR